MIPGILVDRASPIPLARQLETALRAAILSGRLGPGERLLSSREFQTHLGLSRNTIVNALAQLHSEGYLHIERGVGTFVAAHVRRLREEPRSVDAQPVAPSARAARDLDAQELAINLQRTAPFRPGMPALDLFPSAQFRRAFKAGAWTTGLLDYESPCGHLPLREAIAMRLRQTRGIVCDAGDVVVTNGAQAAFTLIARVLLEPGDVAIVEDPGYSNIRSVLLSQGARVFSAPVDEEGIVVASFQKRRAKLACVTPSHQYPSGAVLSLERRFALLRWAAKHDAWIVEDDYDAEFNYTGRPQPALQGLDGGGRVIYVGTFSKVLSPGLRVGYVVVPRALRAAFEAANAVGGGVPGTMLQAALANFIASGALGRHVTKMRAVYDERRRFVRDELLARARSRCDVRDSKAGLHFIALLPKEISDVRVSARAAERGLILPALSSYYFGTAPRNGLVIGYAATSISDAKTAIRALVELL